MVTGGAGYVGSHVCVALLEAGHDVVILDTFENASPKVPVRIARVSGHGLAVIHGDAGNRPLVTKAITTHQIDAVIHLAGLKSVAESTTDPLRYHDRNVAVSIALASAMREAGCKRLVYSSSATVYGAPRYVPMDEDHPLEPLNTYGRTKLMVENILRDTQATDPQWSVMVLRYFNPAGAHPSGMIGEDPAGPPDNLMPYVAQVAVGRRAALSVFGSDYPTPDGTGVRDYIHVMDVADGHLKALDLLNRPGWTALNLGTGTGHSVLQVASSFAAASGRPIALQERPRRPGDLPSYVADPSRAKAVLGWQATRDLATMCADAWRWQSNNPAGYASPHDSPPRIAAQNATPMPEGSRTPAGLRVASG